MSSHLSKYTNYRGRFAPTPSGPLHMGSLVAALASYLDAKANGGKWLVRIDDIDPPREVKGAADSILSCLELFGLTWDESVIFQSAQNKRYEEFLNKINSKVYRCVCSRKQIGNQKYQSTCLYKSVASDVPSSIRFHVDSPVVEFEDGIQLEQSLSQNEDFIIKRKDGLWSYHFSSVVDDHLAGITHVVRGVDLLDSTFMHIQLQKTLGFLEPKYAHIPVLVEENGQKLSKQNLAKPIGQNQRDIRRELKFALGKLGIDVSEVDEIKDMLNLAISQWNINHLVGLKEINNR